MQSPGCSPRVLNDPVILTGLSSVTDDQNTVIEVGRAALWFVVDTSGVELEGVVRSIDGNADGSDVGAGGLKSALATRWERLEAADGGGLVGDGVAAVEGSLGLVRVRSLAVDTVVGDDVLEGISHLSSVASLGSIRGGAVDEVLLGESDEGVSGDGPLTFDGSSAREAPARSALALVLDGSNGALLSPVNAGGESGEDLIVDRGSALEGAVGRSSVTVHGGAELFVGQVTELVHGEGEGLLGLAVVAADV